MIQSKLVPKKIRLPGRIGGSLNEDEEEMLIEETKISNLQRKYERFKKKYALKK